MSKTIRLTAAQALVRYLTAQLTEEGDPIIAGVWGIFGHGNVAGLGEALYASREALPTYRGHNEQTMAHTAIGYAKQMKRRRAMAVTSSIGPGATNMVTAAALAHANRLPCLFIPGDVFGTRAPDPVLQQIEDFQDGTVSANDCFRPVSRYFDRITRPEHIMTALPRAFSVMTDPAECGPATIAFCQDIQAHAFDYPEEFFEPKVWRIRRNRPDESDLADAVAAIRASKTPVIVAGGGVHYSGACDTLQAFAEAHNIPVTETQAGKAALAWDHPMNLGPVGVTGSKSANDACHNADLVLSVGSRLQDFTTGSWSLFSKPGVKMVGLNTAAYDAGKKGALVLQSDAKVGLEELSAALGDYKATGPGPQSKADWFAEVDPLTDAPSDGNALPTDMQVVGAVQRAASANTTIVGAAGTMPSDMHKLWKAGKPGDYHMEYGYSCMGYEIAAGIGAKMAEPHRDITVMLGDGSYMMANSELATAVMMGVKITVVITDNRGFGCINRLQMGTGGEEFNNLLDKSVHEVPSKIDFAAHAAAMGAEAVHVGAIEELEQAVRAAQASHNVSVVVIDTDPYPSSPNGNVWWEVGIPEVSERETVRAARANYEEMAAKR